MLYVLWLVKRTEAGNLYKFDITVFVTFYKLYMMFQAKILKKKNIVHLKDVLRRKKLRIFLLQQITIGTKERYKEEGPVG